jgi:hypothetical protein
LAVLSFLPGILFPKKVLRRNCLLKEIIEGKIKERIEVTRRRGRRRKKLLDDLGEEEDTLI